MHPVQENEGAQGIIADLKAATTIEEWNECLSRLVMLLCAMAKHEERPAGDIFFALNLAEVVRAGFKGGAGRPRKALSRAAMADAIRRYGVETMPDAVALFRKGGEDYRTVKQRVAQACAEAGITLRHGKAGGRK